MVISELTMPHLNLSRSNGPSWINCVRVRVISPSVSGESSDHLLVPVYMR